LIDAETHDPTSANMVPDDKLSLAIGRKAKNVRSRRKMTGWAHRHPTRVEGQGGIEEKLAAL